MATSLSSAGFAWKNLWRRRLRAAAMAMLLPVVCVQAADVHTLLAVPRQRIETADYRVTGHLVRVDANGNRISFPITIKARWFPGVLRVLVEVGPAGKTGAGSTASARAVAHILLEMRPGGESTIQIAHPGDKAPAALPFEQWSDGPLGPGFSYEDFLEEQYFWPGQTALEETKYGTRDCDPVKSVPGAADRTHYAEVKTWLDHTIGFPVYAEKIVRGTGTVKQFTYFGLRHNGGVWSTSQVEEKTLGQAGSTLLIVDRGSAKANLTLRDFSAAQLTHFQD
jgi:hypothetical protein